LGLVIDLIFAKVKTLAIDLSTKTGWALFEDGVYRTSGYLPKVTVDDFNVNNDPNKSPSYPMNLIVAAEAVAAHVKRLIEDQAPDHIVIENTVRGRNRHTQRLLEFLHFCFLKTVAGRTFTYMDPSEWRSVVELRLSKDDKKNNGLVSKGKKRGRINKKHLAVRMVNELYSLGLKIKDNDQADAILLGLAYETRAKTQKAAPLETQPFDPS
jgi:hypothetical protein